MKLNPQDVIRACQTAPSMSQAASQFDVNFQTFRKYAVELGVWRANQGGKGIKKPKKIGGDSYDIQDILANKHPGYSTSHLRVRLLEEGLIENECSRCGIGPEWNGQPLSLQLHHEDGDNQNHNLSNLNMICPNCHTQTDNWGSKIRSGRKTGKSATLRR